MIRLLPSVLCALIVTTAARGGFVHPGCLSTKEDLLRMRSKVAAGEQPWKGSWDILVGNTGGFMNQQPEVQPTIKAGGGGGENYIRMARDCARAYQLALRWHGSGDEAFAEKAVGILNSWAEHHEGWAGDSNVGLRAGIYGYQFACAAELMRGWRGWSRQDFRKFQEYLKKRCLPINRDFLKRHNGTVDSHYWANWDLAAMCSMIAIGVVCDDRATFDEAVAYFRNGAGNGCIRNAVVFLHPDGLGQWQESGRDQGHSLMGPQLTGSFCEIAWNQGVDLYGELGNRLLAGVEYVSKYNLGHDVPYVPYVRVWAHPGKEQIDINARISPHGRGAVRSGWDLLYHHYVNRRGIAAPWTAAYAEKSRPEGGGFNFGGSSGGFDSLGFTTLTHSRDPIVRPAVPGAPRARVEGRRITLSWSGSARATSYNVKRATARGGPFTRIATVGARNLSHVDTGLAPGTTYHYVVSANHADGEGPDGPPLAVAADHQLGGQVIGTDGSFGDRGADKHCAFDGSLDNYFDPPGPGAWVGLDLGADAVLSSVEYCPRAGSAGRMVGGKFQGSPTPDFSSGVVDLLTIRSAPGDGVLTSREIRGTAAFRYVRYIAPPDDGWCNVAEIRFFGTSSGGEAPASPAAPAATTVDGPAIEFSWPEVQGADRYHIRRLMPDGGPDLILGNTRGTSFRDDDVRPGFACHYAVTALNAAGESAPSPVVTVRP